MANVPSYQKAEWRQAWVKDADGKLAQLVVGIFPLSGNYPDRPVVLENDQTPFGQTRRYLTHAEYRFQEKVSLLHLDYSGHQEKIGMVLLSEPRSVSKFLHGYRYTREATETQPAHPVEVGEIWRKLEQAEMEPKPNDTKGLYRFQEALAMLGFSKENTRFDKAFLPTGAKTKTYGLFTDEHVKAGVPEATPAWTNAHVKRQESPKTNLPKDRAKLQQFELNPKDMEHMERLLKQKHPTKTSAKIER